VKTRLRRLFSTRERKITAAVLAVALVAAVTWAAWPTPAPPTIATRDITISAPGGPGVPEPVQLDSTLYVPTTTPAPAVIMAHGFGGSKRSVAADAQDLARAGFVVLAYSARGFGASTGQIGLDSLDYEIPDARALVDWLGEQPEVTKDGPDDPRVGVTGASYGGALSLMLAGTDPRVDAVVPLITWNDLEQSLFPNAQATPADLQAGTPAAASGVGDGVFKKFWTSTLMASITTGAALSASPTGVAQGDSGDSGFVRRGGSGSSSAAPTPAAESEQPATDSAAAPSGSGSGAGSGSASGSGSDSAAAGAAPAASQAATCGRLRVDLCAGYALAAQTGRITPEFSALLEKSSPKAVVGNITAPTLLVQGERDTLFPLSEADANARAIAANGATVAMTWYNGGHDGGSPDAATEARITEWFQHYLAGTGPVPSTAFRYTVDGPLSDTGSARSRTLEAPTYPGLTEGSTTTRFPITLSGAPQFVANPPGASPASISSLPGLSGLASTALSTFVGGLPGQTARFASQPFGELTVITGTPRVTVTVAQLPVPGTVQGASGAGASSGTNDGAVLYGSLAKVSEGGTRTLAGGAVAPIRLTNLPADGTPVTVTVDLPATALQVEAGSTVEVALSTTDQAYAGPTAPAAYRISLADGSGGGASSSALVANGVSAPEVPGTRVSASEIPVFQLVGLAVLALIALLGLTFGGRVRSRRRDVDPALVGVPLSITGLGKSYPGGVQAVTDVSFRVEAGQVLGLLGPNGAGKTTTLRMVMGLITPTAGEIRVFGHRIRPGSDILSRIGSFVEGSGFLPHLSGKANLDLYWKATGRPIADAHLAEALEIAGLGKAVNRKVRTYSQGMRQRLAIAQAMLGLPDLLLLDEPTNGLDPPQIHAMREVLRRYAATGRTVLVSSHLLSEVEQTCSHVVVVHLGRTIASGTVADLVSSSGEMVFTVDDQDAAAAVLRTMADDVEVTETGVQADLRGVAPAAAVSALVSAGIAVTTAAPRNRLEDVFLALIGASGSDGSGAPTGNGVAGGPGADGGSGAHGGPGAGGAPGAGGTGSGAPAGNGRDSAHHDGAARGAGNDTEPRTPVGSGSQHGGPE
jgi:ABC-2 type transport system ATP-binding protein